MGNGWMKWLADCPIRGYLKGLLRCPRQVIGGLYHQVLPVDARRRPYFKHLPTNSAARISNATKVIYLGNLSWALLGTYNRLSFQVPESPYKSSLPNYLTSTTFCYNFRQDVW